MAVNPGDYRITFGRWAGQHPGGARLKDLPRNDVEWIAYTCTAHPEASEMADRYIREHPDEFPQRRAKGKMR